MVNRIKPPRVHGAWPSISVIIDKYRWFPPATTGVAERRSPDQLGSTATPKHDHEYTPLRFVFDIFAVVGWRVIWVPDGIPDRKVFREHIPRRPRPRRELGIERIPPQAEGAFRGHGRPLPNSDMRGPPPAAGLLLSLVVILTGRLTIPLETRFRNVCSQGDILSLGSIPPEVVEPAGSLKAVLD